MKNLQPIFEHPLASPNLWRWGWSGIAAHLDSIQLLFFCQNHMLTFSHPPPPSLSIHPVRANTFALSKWFLLGLARFVCVLRRLRSEWEIDKYSDVMSFSHFTWWLEKMNEIDLNNRELERHHKTKQKKRLQETLPSDWLRILWIPRTQIKRFQDHQRSIPSQQGFFRRILLPITRISWYTRSMGFIGRVTRFIWRHFWVRSRERPPPLNFHFGKHRPIYTNSIYCTTYVFTQTRSLRIVICIIKKIGQPCVKRLNDEETMTS